MEENKYTKRKVNFFEIIPPEDSDTTFEDILSQTMQIDMQSRRHAQSGTDDDEFHQLYMFDKLSDTSDLYAGVYMKCSPNSITASNEEQVELRDASLPEGYRPSFISHFIYSPSTRILSIEAGQRAPKQLSLIRYIHYMQSTVLQQEQVRFVAQAIIDEDMAGIIRSSDGVRSLELSMTSAEIRSTDARGGWMKILELLSTKGNAGKVSIGITGARKRGDMTPAFSAETLANEFENGEFKDKNFGSVRVELLYDQHAIAVNLLQNKIKSDIEMPVYKLAKHTGQIHQAIKKVYEDNKEILIPALTLKYRDEYDKNR